MELELSLLFMEGAGKPKYPTVGTENFRAIKSITEQLYKINPRLTPRPRFFHSSYIVFISLIKARITCKAVVFFSREHEGRTKAWGSRRSKKKKEKGGG